MDVFATGVSRYAHTLVVQEVAERQLLLLRFLGCYRQAMSALYTFFACLSPQNTHRPLDMYVCGALTVNDSPMIAE
jgi:hypothetical protein